MHPEYGSMEQDNGLLEKPRSVRHSYRSSVGNHSFASQSAAGYRNLTRTPLPKGCITCTVLNAALVLTLGLLLLLLAPALIQDYIASVLPIADPTSVIFPQWQDPASAADTYRSYYWMNVTNVDDIFDYHAAPNYEIVGPFVYRELLRNPMDSIFWLPNTSIRYNYYTDLEFVPSMSVGDPKTTNVTNLNVALSATTYRLSKLPSTAGGRVIVNIPGTNITIVNITQKEASCDLLDVMVGDNRFGDTGVFTSRSIHDLLYGYNDTILSALAGPAADMNYSVAKMFRTFFNHSQPAPSPYDYRHGQRCPMWDDQSECNTTGNQPTMAYSGADWHTDSNPYSGGGMKEIGIISKWAGQEKLWWWGEEGGCQDMVGGNGMLYEVGIDESSRPSIFVDSLWRNVEMQFEQHTKVKGIQTNRYRIADSEMQFSSKSECYNQYWEGIMNLTVPMFGPLYASRPFFLGAPPVQVPRGGEKEETLLNFTVNGVPIGDFQAQNANNYQTYVDVLSVTGSMLEGHANLQSSTIMQELGIDDCPGIFKLTAPKNITLPGTNTTIVNSTFPKTLVPIFYLDRHGLVKDSVADRIKREILLPFTLCSILGGILAGACPVILAVGALWIRRDRMRRARALKDALHDYDEVVENLRASMAPNAGTARESQAVEPAAQGANARALAHASVASEGVAQYLASHNLSDVRASNQMDEAEQMATAHVFNEVRNGVTGEA